ncbi:hypothetical protein [Robertmurraya sp. Marseille-Q9965]
MYEYLNRIAHDLTPTKLNAYWPDFEMVAYAIYDRDHVHLFNHPKFANSYVELNRNEQFNGSCTLILYEEYPTAIVNLDLFSDYESLYSILVHELFHGFQYLKGDKRYPDETLGMTYPLLLENIEIRNKEREKLYHAVMTDDLSEKETLIKTFIALRKRRESQIKEHVLYENLIETIEGPAWYVEYKALSQISSEPKDSILNKFVPMLTDELASALHTRRSCYGSGLFICLILKEILPEWKESFLTLEKSLFEILSEQFSNSDEVSIKDIAIGKKTEEIFKKVLEEKNRPFKQFMNTKGTHLYIDGKIMVTSFDPMNIVSLDDKRLHQNFIGVSINNEKYSLQQPVVTYSKDDFKSIDKLHLILMEEPIVNQGSLVIAGMGVLSGITKKINGDYCFFAE